MALAVVVGKVVGAVVVARLLVGAAVLVRDLHELALGLVRVLELARDRLALGAAVAERCEAVARVLALEHAIVAAHEVAELVAVAGARPAVHHSARRAHLQPFLATYTVGAGVGAM